MQGIHVILILTDNHDVLLLEVDKVNAAEIIKNAMDEFKDIQEYMLIAREENATKTYARLKKKYIYLKALLNSLSVNLAEIDEIKE